MPVKFSEEFKRDAVALVLTQGMSQKQVCADMGISKSALQAWVRNLVELEFVENRRTPCGSVGALDGEGKKEVALQARPQHARVESGREHSAILSGDDLSLGRPASLRLPSGPL